MYIIICTIIDSFNESVLMSTDYRHAITCIIIVLTLIDDLKESAFHSTGTEHVL